VKEGSKIGLYEVIKPLGEGGMGVVYLARDDRLERTIALKVLPDEFSRDENRRNRFLAEARAASALKHPNITHIYQVGEDGDTLFIAMEHVEGSDLTSSVARAPLESTEVVRIGVQLADALADAHEAGITHRDIKPGNIMLTPRGQVKVLDFGLAKLRMALGDGIDDEAVTQTMTQPGLVMGTVRYMSPEQALGKDVDPRSDLFSVGIVLYELATGEPPFKGETPTETITKITRDQPAPVQTFNADVPDELERIIRKCLEKDPDRRYQSARDLMVDLRNLKRDTQSGSTSTVIPQHPRSKTWRFAAGAAAVAAVVFGALFGAGVFQGDAEAIESIAVLPFENGTGDPDAEYLCDGLTVSLINSLSGVPELRVISRRSSFTFKDSAEDPEAIGRKLGVEALVMGRMTRLGDQLAVSAELVDVAENRQIWGDQFDHVDGDVLAIEKDLSSALTRNLEIDLTGEAANQLARRYEVDPEAHQLYLRGRQLTIGSSREMNRAVEYYRQAIDVDPGFALAHAHLGHAYLIQAYHSVMDRDEAVGKARAAVNTALEIDANLAEAHAVSAQIKYLFDWDWEGADRDLKRATELNPGSDTARIIYADFLASMGRFDEAIFQAEKAQELDPLSPSATHMLAFALMGIHDYERAATEFRAALDLNPNWTWGYIKLTKTLADSDRCAEALETAAEAEAQLHGGSTPLARSWLGYSYATCGEAELAADALVELDRMAEEQYVDPGCYAELYTAIGTMDQVLDALEQTVADHSPDAIYTPVIPDYFLPELADEPRFQALLKKMNIPARSVRKGN